MKILNSPQNSFHGIDEIRSDIKSKHESKLYKLITDISEDLRDNKGYSEEEIKIFLIEQILEIVNES